MFFSNPKRRSPLKDPRGGLTQAGREYFRRKEGANLKPGVRGAANTPEKMRRKGSFLRRFYGRKVIPPLTTPSGKPTRYALAAHAWGEKVPRTIADVRRLGAKGTALLKRYHATRKRNPIPCAACIALLNNPAAHTCLRSNPKEAGLPFEVERMRRTFSGATLAELERLFEIAYGPGRAYDRLIYLVKSKDASDEEIEAAADSFHAADRAWVEAYNRALAARQSNPVRCSACVARIPNPAAHTCRRANPPAGISYALFPLGQIVITANAQQVVFPDDARAALRRHASGDWGEVGEEDRASNDEALREGERLLSAYRTDSGIKFWIITEWDRSATTILLPEDY